MVISIISLLASIVLTSLNSARDNSKDAAIKAEMNQIRNAAAIYFAENGHYDDLFNPVNDAGKIFASALSKAPLISSNQNMESDDTARRESSKNVLVGRAKDLTPGKWAAVLWLNNDNWFCVDYSGVAVEQEVKGIQYATENSDMEC